MSVEDLSTLKADRAALEEKKNQAEAALEGSEVGDLEKAIAALDLKIEAFNRKAESAVEVSENQKDQIVELGGTSEVLAEKTAGVDQRIHEIKKNPEKAGDIVISDPNVGVKNDTQKAEKGLESEKKAENPASVEASERDLIIARSRFSEPARRILSMIAARPDTYLKHFDSPINGVGGIVDRSFGLLNDLESQKKMTEEQVMASASEVVKILNGLADNFKEKKFLGIGDPERKAKQVLIENAIILQNSLFQTASDFSNPELKSKLEDFRLKMVKRWKY